MVDRLQMLKAQEVLKRYALVSHAKTIPTQHLRSIEIRAYGSMSAASAIAPSTTSSSSALSISYPSSSSKGGFMLTTSRSYPACVTVYPDVNRLFPNVPAVLVYQPSCKPMNHSVVPIVLLERTEPSCVTCCRDSSIDQLSYQNLNLRKPIFQYWEKLYGTVDLPYAFLFTAFFIPIIVLANTAT